MKGLYDITPLVRSPDAFGSPGGIFPLWSSRLQIMLCVCSCNTFHSSSANIIIFFDPVHEKVCWWAGARLIVISEREAFVYCNGSKSEEKGGGGEESPDGIARGLTAVPTQGTGELRGIESGKKRDKSVVSGGSGDGDIDNNNSGIGEDRQ